MIRLPRQPILAIGRREFRGPLQEFVQTTIIERVQIIEVAQMALRRPRVGLMPTELTVGRTGDQLRHSVSGAAETLHELIECGDRKIERPRTIKPLHVLNVTL
ncbi:MAG TPA: hypothetical protein VFA43_17775, partial [Gemmatimonadaceae bacterium]|nr:hypothetical protein [Gemmatimonadaceae bacterium]